MTEVSAAAVKALREKTGLPMMECKRALQETGGDATAAVEWLRKQGVKTKELRLGRETSAGRIAIYCDAQKRRGAIIELKCESAPVAGSQEFKQFADDLAQQLALSSTEASSAALLALPSLAVPGKTLGDQKDDMFNRIREVFNVGRVARFEGQTGGYVHHDGSCGALVEAEGGTPELIKDVAMHIVAQKPQVVAKEDLDPAAVEKEREILAEGARREGKPENIIAKMVEGRLKNFYAEQVLSEQPFVKDDSQTVGQLAAAGKMKIIRFMRWDVGK